MTKKKKQQKKQQEDQPLGDEPTENTVIPKEFVKAHSARRLAFMRAIFVLELLNDYRQN